MKTTKTEWRNRARFMRAMKRAIGIPGLCAKAKFVVVSSDYASHDVKAHEYVEGRINKALARQGGRPGSFLFPVPYTREGQEMRLALLDKWIAHCERMAKRRPRKRKSP